MARIALITADNIVNNIVISDSEEHAMQLWPNVIVVDLDKTKKFTNIGWSYIDGEFIAPPTGSSI